MYRQITSILNLEKGTIRLLALFSTCVSILSLIVPIALQTIVNTLAFSTLKQPLVILVISMIFILVLAGLIRVCQLSIVENIQQKLFVNNALNFAKLLPRLKYHLVGSHRSPEIINRFLKLYLFKKQLPLF